MGNACTYGQCVLLQILQNMPGRDFEYLMISGHLEADEDLKHINSDNVTLMRKPIDIEALLLFLEEREFVATPKH